MLYFWLIVGFLLAIGIAIEWRRFRRLRGPQWFWWMEEEPAEELCDHDLRYEARERDIEVNLFAEATDRVEEPDVRIERLIEEGDFERAFDYLMQMSERARINRDERLLRDASIYRARIAAREAEIEQAIHGRVHDDVELKRAGDAARRSSEPLVNVSAENFHMPAAGKPDKPPLWTRKVEHPEGLGPKQKQIGQAPMFVEAIDSPKKEKPRRRFLEFRFGAPFRPPLKRRDREVDDETNVGKRR
jgi:hypothetical protein